MRRCIESVNMAHSSSRRGRSTSDAISGVGATGPVGEHAA
jgi:hypothetical protein